MDKKQSTTTTTVNFISNKSGKFLILHGKDDALVPISQAEVLKDGLQVANVPVTYFAYSGGHSIPPEHLEEAIQHIEDFTK